MKRLALFITLFILCPALHAAKPEVRFGSDGFFKIIQLTDLHFVADKPVENEKTFARMDYIVGQEHPDFIAITGDVIFGRKPSKALLQSILDKLDSFQVPFAIVYGNHDAEQDMSRAEMSKMIVSAKYSVNTLNPDGELADIRIPVGSTAHPGSDPLDMYFLDSHDYASNYNFGEVGGYAWFTLEQQLWLRDECNDATAANGGRHVPSFAFFHIPFPEFLEAWEASEEKKHNGTMGIRGEYGGHPRVNSGMFATMLETGNIFGVFCGHDHDSDFIVPHYGIALAYGRYSGDDNVYNHLPHGTRVIQVKEGERAFRTWIHEDDGRIQRNVTFAEGKIQ